MHRRHFLGAAATGLSAKPAPTGDVSAARDDFPRARHAVYLDNASCHPLSVHSAAAIHRYVDWETHEVGEPWWPPWARPRHDAKILFAALLNAKPSEIAFARSTIEAESNILNGMNLQGGNVVTTDLHYSAALYHYRMRQRDGLDVRVVKHRKWRIDLNDLDRAIDRNTRLVAVALVSNVNGYFHDIQATSALAHARGAYVYADIIQCAGAVPIDVRAMGIDLAACSTYKWLMGVKGFGFLYVREDLQGAVVKPMQHSGGVRFNYPPWVERPDPAVEEIAYQPVTGPARYEVSYPSYEGVIAALESLSYIQRLGVGNIRAYVRTLTDRLMKELPARGYPSITPPGNDSPIVAFEARDPAKTMERLRAANVHVAMRFGNRMRISPSVYNNQRDLDRLLEALA